MSKFEPDCTRKCKSRSHGQALTSSITKRSVSNESLASFIKSTCANFPKAFDFEGRTALHMTASRGRNSLMEWLVRHSSDAFVNARDRESGYTPLHRSIFYGQIHSAVSLIKMGVKTEIVDKDDYNALEHSLLDRRYMWQLAEEGPRDVYVWGANTNYTLATGSQQPRAAPDLLTCFSRTHANIKQVCLGKFHSVWVCEAGGGAGGCEAWCGGQVARAGGPPVTALRPVPLALPEPCVAAAIMLDATVFLLQSGAVVQYSLNNDNVSASAIKTPSTIKLAAMRPLLKLSSPLGLRAGRLHAAAWTPHAVYTWGTNVGQLGHSPGDRFVTAPKKVAISMNNKEECTIELVDTGDAATVVTTSRGDVYLLHKHICKKIAIKQINLRQACVEARVCEAGALSRVTVLLLTRTGQLLLWHDAAARLTRCVFGLNHEILVTHVALTHDFIYFTTKFGEAYAGTVSRKAAAASPPAPKRERDKDSTKSALVKFLEKDDCTSVRITKIPNVHRAVSIAVDSEGLNFACIQIKPTCGLRWRHNLSPSSFSKHMESLYETAADDDILHDVIFKVRTKLYPAHIFVVASSSEHLYKLYQDARTARDQKPIVTIENVHPEAFERVLRYIYTGTCDVTEPGPNSLKIRKEDMTSITNKGKEDNIDDEEVVIENPAEISAFEAHRQQERRRGRRRSAEPRASHCEFSDPVRVVQAAARRLGVAALHKALDKFYYRDGTIYLKESSTYTKASLSWDRLSFPELVDTNVCTKDGVLIPAHKCVLACRLEYFNGMFMHSWSESKLLSTVTLPINHGILLPVINFLYTDFCPEVEYSDSIDFICSMLIVADQLLITRLREMCEGALANLISLKNCTEICQFAHTYNATQLKTCCMQFISLNLCTILENRALDLLEDTLLEDITRYYCMFNPIMSSRIITPFYNAPEDIKIDEIAKLCPVDLDVTDEDMKREDHIVEVIKKKNKTSKKIEYTDNEKARMQYESVSLVTSLDLINNNRNNNQGDVKLALSSISKEKKEIVQEKDKWIEVPSAQQKQQKIIQARLKAITTDISNEAPVESFIRISKNNFSNTSASPESILPTTSRMSVSPQGSPISEARSTGNIFISHVGPKLSQKQRKKLAMQGSDAMPQNLDNYLANKLQIGSPPDKPKNPWKVCEAPLATSSPIKQKGMGFNQILADQKKQKDDSSRIMSKSLMMTQLEDKAIEELERFYNIHDIDDELITVKRIQLTVSSPQWVHTATK